MLSDRGANLLRSSLQSLLVDVGCECVPGLLPGRVVQYPGSPRLGSATLGSITQPFQGWCFAEREGEGLRLDDRSL